jgi:hypothetical protein
MTRNHGDRGIRKLAVDHVKIGAPHATRQHLHEHLGWTGYGFIGLDRVDVAETIPGQRHRLHRILVVRCQLQRLGFSPVHEASEQPLSTGAGAVR